MTVRELKDMLDMYEDWMEVKVGKYQNFGSNFVYDIWTVEELEVTAFFGADFDAVVIVEGSQEGVI